MHLVYYKNKPQANGPATVALILIKLKNIGSFRIFIFMDIISNENIRTVIYTACYQLRFNISIIIETCY